VKDKFESLVILPFLMQALGVSRHVVSSLQRMMQLLHNLARHQMTAARSALQFDFYLLYHQVPDPRFTVGTPGLGVRQPDGASSPSNPLKTTRDQPATHKLLAAGERIYFHFSNHHAKFFPQNSLRFRRKV
jgi:hypothetical protein